MGIPGGGKSLINSRVMRHFNLMFIPEFSGANLEKIFSSILEWGLAAYPPDVLKSSK